MSKKKAKEEPQQESSVATIAYSVIPKRGGFQIIAFTIVDGVITSIQEIGTEDVFVHTGLNLQALIRKDLGI